MSTLVCGTALAADITGTYLGWFDNNYEKENSVVIKTLSDDEYFVEVITSHPDGGDSCGFTGKGKLIGSSIQAITVKDGEKYVLPLYFKKDNTIEIPSNDHVFGLTGPFCGANSAIDLSGTFRKK